MILSYLLDKLNMQDFINEVENAKDTDGKTEKESFNDRLSSRYEKFDIFMDI